MPSSMKRPRSDINSSNSPRKEARHTRKVRISDEPPSEKAVSPGAKEYNRENTMTSEERRKARLNNRFYPNEYILSKAEQELISDGLLFVEEAQKYNQLLKENTESNSYQGIKTRAEMVQFMRLKAIYERLEEERNQLIKQLEEQEKTNHGGNNNRRKKTQRRQKSRCKKRGQSKKKGGIMTGCRK